MQLYFSGHILILPVPKGPSLTQGHYMNINCAKKQVNRFDSGIGNAPFSVLGLSEVSQNSISIESGQRGLKNSVESLPK